MKQDETTAVKKHPVPVQAEPLTDEEIDHLLANLSSDEIEKLLEDVESNPDDTFLPPSARCTYHCEKKPTGAYNRKKLLGYIYDQAKKTPDKIDYVPHVPGVTRGKKYVAPEQEKLLGIFDNEDIELDIEIGDEATRPRHHQRRSGWLRGYLAVWSPGL